ncbi:putative membrane protein [Herbaspirillum sp. CF444]|uniref:bestrophin family protein n=1 Tax=Herbaspirillum sp. CF444 TaxID=1144319 RepID=UPI00027262E6|nr:bestrophin family ion channel [Herbaspirillum sp. CF444]EJL92788.1 putative membrane protein [Herbaspirillum sp. CF444]
MIVRPQQNWFRMLLVWDGSVLPSILPQMALMTIVSTLAVVTKGSVLGEKLPLNIASFTLLGLALAIFLAFRNNASYERFWEARKMWGQLLISARTLTSQAQRYGNPGTGEFDQALFENRLIAFVYALKHQLRHSAWNEDLGRLLSGEDLTKCGQVQYRPVMLLDRLRDMIAVAHRSGHLCSEQLWMLDHQLNELSVILGACERIASTPIPYPYSVLLHRTVYVYCLLLPFGLVDTIGIATPVISVFVSYTFLALEAIASEISEPFGTAPNCLALDAIATEIERTVLELGGREIPPSAAVGKNFQLS